jgi:hypothetical protein
VTGKVKLLDLVENPGPPAGPVRARRQEDALEVPELLGNREHLAGRQRPPPGHEDRHAVARERRLGEHVGMLEVHTATVAPGHAIQQSTSS